MILSSGGIIEVCRRSADTFVGGVFLAEELRYPAEWENLAFLAGCDYPKPISSTISPRPVSLENRRSVE